MLACEPEVPAEKEAWEEVAADFEKETGIQVELRFQGTWSDIPQTLQQSKLAGDQIDIVRVGIGTISSTLGAAGGVKDLTDLASPLLDRYSDGMIDNCYIGGHLWHFRIMMHHHICVCTIKHYLMKWAFRLRKHG